MSSFLRKLPSSLIAAACLIGAAQANATTFAYVPNNSNVTLSVIDTSSQTQIAVISSVGDAQSAAVAPNGSIAYVVDDGGNHIFPINTTTNTRGAAITPGVGPDKVTFSSDSATAYVSNYVDSSISVIDVLSGTVTATVAAVCPGGSPHPIDSVFHGTSLLIVCSGFTSVVVSMDTAAGNALTTLATVGNAAHNMAISTASGFGYVSNYGSSTISKFDLTTGATTNYATTGVGSPLGVAVTPDGSKIYVGDYISHNLIVMDPSGTITKTMNLGGNIAGIGMSSNGSVLYVPLNGLAAGIKVIDTATDTVVNTIANPGAAPNFIVGNFLSNVAANAAPVAPVVPTPPPAPPPKISYSAPQAVSENGTTSAVTFTLNGGAPGAAVTLPIVSTNTSEVTVSPASVTFTPGGAMVQTVTFTGVDDQVVDGDQAVLIKVGPVVSTDTSYNGYSPGNFVIVNRDNDMALPSLPFAGGTLSGFVDITNAGNSAIASIAARAYDKSGALKGSGTITQNLPARGTVSIDMGALQTALGITIVDVTPGDPARIELLPVGGTIMAQGRIKAGSDLVNASAANRVGAANLPASNNADQFTLRITNLSATAQDARATLYSDSGSLLSAPNALLASQLAPRASLDLTAASLQTLLGIAPWVGRAQLTMSNGSNFAVQMMNVASGMRAMNPLLGIGNGGGSAADYVLPPGDATGDSFVRVYNQENFTVGFVGSLYNTSGTLLGSAALGSATAKGELILSSNQLKSLFSANWTGPARLLISSDMTSFGMQSTVRHANVLTDVSTVITDNVINHLPDATEGVDIELRIVNPSIRNTIVTGTLTNSAGLTVGSPNFAIGTIAPNGSLMVSRANLVALAGSWSGRATLTLSTNNAVEVLALLRNTTTGVFTNLSERPLR